MLVCSGDVCSKLVEDKSVCGLGVRTFTPVYHLSHKEVLSAG